MPQFDSSAFWGIVGIVVGIIVATFFFVIGMKRSRLRYLISSTPLITKKMVKTFGINISLNNRPIKKLYSTTITFINSGNQSISSSDFANQAPLCVILTGRLYGFDASVGNQKLRPSLIPDKGKTVRVEFEALKPRKYFKVTLLHNGSLTVSGELKTGDMRVYRSSRIIVYLLFVFFILFLVISIDFLIDGPIYLAFPSASFPLLLILGGVAAFFDFLYLYRTIVDESFSDRL